MIGSMIGSMRLKNRPVEAQAAGTSRPTGDSEISQNWDEIGLIVGSIFKTQ